MKILNFEYVKGIPIDELTTPKISYAYLCYNMIKERGEQWVRDSFESIKNQSDDIMVIDQCSEDNIKKLTEEFGFRYINLYKTKGVFCHSSKMTNKAVINSKYNIFVVLSPDIIYPSNLSHYIVSLFKSHDPKKERISFKVFFEIDGKIHGQCPSNIQQGRFMIHWKPYLISARGWDERTSYYAEYDFYMRTLYSEVFKLKVYNPPHYFFIHREHPPLKQKRTKQQLQIMKDFDRVNQLNLLRSNLKNNRKLVKNSYW